MKASAGIIGGGGGIGGIGGGGGIVVGWNDIAYGIAWGIAILLARGTGTGTGTGIGTGAAGVACWAIITTGCATTARRAITGARGAGAAPASV